MRRLFWNSIPALFTCLAVCLAAGTLQAASITLDGFEGSEGHFDRRPKFSGSSSGIVDATSTAELDATMAHSGSESQLLTLVPETAGSGFTIRHLSGTGSAANNVALGNTGAVGYWLKTDAADMTTRIGIDDSADSTERSVIVPIIGDGEWHLYEWDLGDAANWTPWVGSSNGEINGNATIDAIWLTAASTQDTVLISLDDVVHNPDGSNAIPEPSTFALVGLGLAGMALVRRRR